MTNTEPSNKIAKIDNPVAKIDNSFILNAQYKLTSKEQKVLYYLISQLDPKNEKEFYTITIPIKDLEIILGEGEALYDAFYDDIRRICKLFISKTITFPSNFLVNGKRLESNINWFQSIVPVEDEYGQICIEFEFSNKMTPFLLQLQKYVNIGVSEVVQMKNAHAIRMYSIFKSERDRLKGIKEIIILHYILEDLKAMLGLIDKYKSDYFKNFKVNVLDRIKEDINENCPTMYVNYDYVKLRQKITGIKFTVYEKKATAGSLEQPKKEPKEKKQHSKDYTPSLQELEVLTRSKKKAFEKLIELGVFEGIAYKQIIPTIKGSEFEGYEDIFIEKAILHFEKTAIQTTTKALKASTFVTWWTKNKVFESGEVWADILEKVVNHKKHLQKANVTAFENRIIAKAMTNTQFEEYIKKKIKNE